MKEYVKLPIRKFYFILIPLGILILLLSLEVMIQVKDIDLFNIWMNNLPDEGLTEQELFNIYVSGHLSMYFVKIIIPMGLSIHAYFSYTKIRINYLFVFIWTVLLVGSLAYALMDFRVDSVFTYLYLIIYAIVITTVLSLSTVIRNNKHI